MEEKIKIPSLTPWCKKEREPNKYFAWDNEGNVHILNLKTGKMKIINIENYLKEYET